MNKSILVLTSLLGAFGVILGALGAHALKERLGVDGLKTFETGVKYHMIHVLALLILQLFPQLSQNDKLWVSILFLLGILFFSGSLYVISTDVISAKSIWFITPLGGIMFIAGWILLAWKFFRGVKI
jgi:uncharacterized membrane protein YgdD (TMEM256/DUF423 family)